MEVEARIEFALLAVVLSTPGEDTAASTPPSPPLSWPESTLNESQGSAP
jgi:hypothetical protein